jgi:peptide/nickel transport system substrate-binding protein
MSSEPNSAERGFSSDHPVLAVPAAFLTLGLAACGDDSSGGGEGKTGGTIKISHTAFPDYLDPALSFTVDGWQSLLQAYPGLLVFPHEWGQWR